MTEVVLQSSALVMRLSIKSSYLVVQQLTSETFPTVASATGTSVVQVFGRVGSMVTPPMYELCYRVTDLQVAIYYLAALLLMSSVAAVVLVLPSNAQESLDAATEGANEIIPTMLSQGRKKGDV